MKYSGPTSVPCNGFASGLTCSLAPQPDPVGHRVSGSRKVRVASGGSSVIYCHFTSALQIALLLIYPKNEKDDLSADERKVLKQIIERWR